MTESNLTLIWEQGALEDRLEIFHYLYVYNPEAAERTDKLIEKSSNSLLDNPERGVKKNGFKGRCMVMSDVPFFIFYDFDKKSGLVKIMKVRHQSRRVLKTEH